MFLYWGDDEFSVKAAAKKAYTEACKLVGGFDHETIDASAANSDESIKAIAKVIESIQTLPFFGGGKVVWMQNASMFGDDKTASSQAVSEMVAALVEVLKKTDWNSLMLLISAPKVDRRKTFFKTVDKVGKVEAFPGLSAEDREWEGKAAQMVRNQLREQGREMSGEAIHHLISSVGPNARGLINEVIKLCVFKAPNQRIEFADVDNLVPKQRQAKAFALSEAVGDRDLPKALRLLEEELWSMKTEPKKNEISLLYGLISKIRLMLIMKELVRNGRLSPTADYRTVTEVLPKLPEEAFPLDLPFSPSKTHPFPASKAMEQARRFTSEELVRALQILLDSNRQLVTSGLDGAIVLQNALVKILTSTSGIESGRRVS